MTITAQAPATSVRTGWTVHVQVELGRTCDQVDPADDLAMALVTRADHRDVSVIFLDDVVCATWCSRAGDDVPDAGHALVRGLDVVLALITRHVEVSRVRQAWVEGPEPTAGAGPAVRSVGAVA